MNKYSFNILVTTIVGLLFIGCSSSSADMQQHAPDTRSITLFNDGWEFTLDEEGTSGWEKVRLPHTPKIEPLVVNDQWQGTCWYRKSIKVDQSEDEKTFIRFEGVMHEADVWVDSVHIAHHLGGYLPFIIDITPYIKNGSAEIKVRVNNEDNPLIPPGKPLKDLDFNYYGGIYRDVFLITKNEVYITDAVEDEEKGGGVLIHFDNVTSEKGKGVIEVQFKNSTDEIVKAHLTATLKNGDDVIEWTSEAIEVASTEDGKITKAIEVAQPKLWSPQHPNLYELEVLLYANDQLVDRYVEKTGIRSIALQEDGFYLNGEKLYIQGTNRHQEYPYIGYALSPEANYRDAVKIKNAGFDLVRLAHYPQSKDFLDACDELGLIVMNCLPGWQFMGDDKFREVAFQNIRDMVRRDRNHPSIFFWEVSLNESNMDDAFMTKANEILREELPFEHVYSAGWIDHASYDLFIPARQHAKPPHYWNHYKEGKRSIFIAEYGDWEYYAHNAGFNQKAFSDLKEEERTSRQLRGVGEKGLLQQALNFQEAANSNRRGSNGTIGDANWLMFDYNRGYAPDIEASGISDIFRIPKFAYYFYKSQRSPEESLEHPALESGPMVHIASYWEPTSSKEIKVYSNCEEVALYLNDELIARNAPDTSEISSHLKHPPFVFDVPNFKAGTLRAVGYIDDEEVVEHQVSTPGKPAKIQLTADQSGKAFPANDVIFVYAQILDEDNKPVRENAIPISFTLEGGKAEIIGGNMIDSEGGISTILLKTQETGSIIIKASGEQLQGDELSIEVQDQ